MNIIEIILNALKLILSADTLLYEIIFLSLKVSLIALFISSFFAIIAGYTLALKNFYLKNFLLILFNSLMGIPPVVVGLIVYFFFANGGPLGVFQLLYTPTAMVIAQILIIFPIVASLSHEIFLQNWQQYKDHIRSLNIPFFGVIKIFTIHSYFLLITVLLSAFGRAISEVGAVMIVGGNIDHYTRVMTTAISLETRMGNLEYAMALGIVLIVLTMIIYSIVYLFNLKRRIE
jgi:tungstate transport system permease protein